MKKETNAELLLASKNAITGDVLYTWRLTFPRPILAEVNTHRVASRNTSSSRAIPMKTMRKAVMNDPFIPVSLGANQKGMQAGAEITGWKRKAIKGVIRLGSYFAAAQNYTLDALGAHKQVSNRYLEPYSWCTQIFSATDVKNLLLLRNHSAAEPHFQILAKQMADQVEYAREIFEFFEINDGGLWDVFEHCQILQPGEWHLPFITDEEQTLPLEEKKMISSARCARTSYKLFSTGEASDIDSDLTLCKRLFGSQPMHLSPTEHPAQATPHSTYDGNFRGFKQYRKELPSEDGGDHRSSADAVFTLDEVGVLSKLLDGYVVGPSARAVLNKIHEIAAPNRALY